MPFWGSLSVWVTLGTLRHCGHYGMHLPLGIPCVTVKGSVREGCLSLWGSCQFSVIMSSLCHHRGSSRHWDVSVSWGLVSLGFCVFEGPCPITEFPRMKGFLCHFWDFIGKPCALWGPCASVGDICDNYVGICVLPGLLSLGLPLFWGAAVPRQPPLIMGFSVITGVLSLSMPKGEIVVRVSSPWFILWPNHLAIAQ